MPKSESKLLSFKEIEKLIEDEIEEACYQQKHNAIYYSEEDERIIISMVKNKKKFRLD